MPNPHFLIGIALRQRQKQRVANQFDNAGGIVAVVLNFVEFKKAKSDLIVYQLPVRGVFNVQRRNWCLFMEALTPLQVKGALLLDRIQAEIVEQRVEFDGLAGL